ncbi:MAG: YczE/YyaS/YitT family protein [Terrisporobacter sp.]|uniref:YczE/YyaS/YitT family protein n=1 Tax=Terrisporobacter sp. TaxID=1965305 RepID=UPI00399558B6
MNKFIRVITRLLLGFIVYGLAIVVMIHANVGLSPWDVLHQGISLKTGLTMGKVSISVGIIIIIIDAILGEGIGFAALGNVLLIGTFLDMFESLNIIPYANNLFIGIIMMIIGVVLAALATVLYLKPALGSGPRDGLMLAINKRSSKSVGTVRTIIELSVLFIGWILGGSVGIGTIISGVGLGYAIEIGFKISHMDSKTLVHKNIYDSIKLLRNKDAQIATCVETDKEK